MFYLFLSALVLPWIAQETGHVTSGTSYGKEGVIAYESNRHGPDGARFLDPYFTPYLMHLEGLKVIDAGCGAAPWAIYAAQNGAEVFGIDLQEEMIAAAKKNVEAKGLSEQIALRIGDVAELPCPDESFDLAISINVGCNLPSTTQIGEKYFGLGPHVKEMARVLKEGGMAVVTAPASFGIVFTDGTSQELALAHIAEVLNGIPENPSPSEIKGHLNELKEVYRATFALQGGRISLIRDEGELEIGEPIWRKLPGLTVPNRYHPESEYLEEFADGGFILKEAHHPKSELMGEFSEEYRNILPFLSIA